MMMMFNVNFIIRFFDALLIFCAITISDVDVGKLKLIWFLKVNYFPFQLLWLQTSSLINQKVIKVISIWNKRLKVQPKFSISLFSRSILPKAGSYFILSAKHNNEKKACGIEMDGLHLFRDQKIYVLRFRRCSKQKWTKKLQRLILTWIHFRMIWEPFKEIL